MRSVDAALDLSPHTQYIGTGTLFGHAFPRCAVHRPSRVAQRKGLFTNADVLFQTRLRYGTSVIERTAQRSALSLYNAVDRVEQQGAGAGGGGCTSEGMERCRVMTVLVS